MVALPLVLSLFLAPHHRRESAKTLRIFESVQPPSRRLAEELMALRPTLPRGARVLFIDHPFAKDQYFLLFLIRLLYRDVSIAVEEAPASHGARTGQGHYDAVFTFQQGRLMDATGPG